jgi:hypothetical protein
MILPGSGLRMDLTSIDWEGPNEDVDWEKCFGAHVTSEQAKGFFLTFAIGHMLMRAVFPVKSGLRYIKPI